MWGTILSGVERNVDRLSEIIEYRKKFWCCRGASVWDLGLELANGSEDGGRRGGSELGARAT